MLMIVMVHLYIGIDWGFSVDPTAAIEAYTKDDCLYIRNACAKVGLELDDTANYLKTIFQI